MNRYTREVSNKAFTSVHGVILERRKEDLSEKLEAGVTPVS